MAESALRADSTLCPTLLFSARAILKIQNIILFSRSNPLFALALNFSNPRDHKILSLNCLGGDKTPQGGNKIKSVAKEGAKNEEERRGKEDRQTKGRSAREEEGANQLERKGAQRKGGKENGKGKIGGVLGTGLDLGGCDL